MNMSNICNRAVETLSGLINFRAENSDDFYNYFIEELVNKTDSQDGLVFTLSNSTSEICLTYCYRSARSATLCAWFPDHFNPGEAGIWLTASELNSPYLLNTQSQLLINNYDNEPGNIVNRLVSFPVESSDGEKYIFVIANKRTDYNDEDLEFLELLKVPFLSIIKNLKLREVLIDAKERAEERDNRKNSYLNFISHEIKTPVNAISGFSHLLKEDGQSDEDRKKFTEIIIESSDKLISIINKVSEISNIETGVLKIVEKEIDICQICTSLFNQFSRADSNTKINFNIDIRIDKSDALIISDGDKIIQIISALLSNAFQFTFTGRITLGCFLRDEFIEFFVEDTGTGISENEKAKVFSHFYQAGDSVVKAYKGTGLELTIARALVEKMCGKIWFNSKVGVGSDFHFTVPYKRTSSQKISGVSNVQDVLVKHNSKPIVLVAEDDNMNYALIKNILSKLDIDLKRAMNGSEAVEFCSSGHVDLVLMDIRMPVMDGYTATRLIKEINPGLTIIAQTAYTDDREVAIGNGCNDFIAKPFGKQELLSLINLYL
jgi:signal transduction histidine kinase/CheY-like chemotaxis protein